MLFVLSPAKALDYESAVPAHVSTLPRFIPESTELIGLLRQRDAQEIADLMDLSENLAQLNVRRYVEWSPQKFQAQYARAAVLAFDGDVYDGLQARHLKPADLKWLQKHVRILSGLYGVLRPLDAMQPYRLELGTALPNPKGRDLYAYWGEKMAHSLNDDLADLGESMPVLVNLASQEYFKSVPKKALQARVVECVFQDAKLNDRGQAGPFKVVSFYAKRARGLMVRFAVLHRLKKVEDLKGFDLEGYAYAPAQSSAQKWVFQRVWR